MKNRTKLYASLYSALFLIVLLLSWVTLGHCQNYARMISAPNNQLGATYLFIAADSTRLTTFQNSSAIAATLPSGANAGFGIGNEFAAQNLGPGTVTITCSSCLIYSSTSSGAATFTLSAGQGVELFSAGANYYAFTGSGVIGGGGASAAQIGDTLRNNVNGDGMFDAVNMAQPVTTIYPVLGGAPVITGPMTTGYTTLTGAGSTSVNPTATHGGAGLYTAAATASTSTLIGMIAGQNGSNSTFGMLAFYRWSLTASIGQLTNARCWMGLGTWNNTGTGNNTAAILNTTAYATDTPNKTTIGFLIDTGAFSTVQAETIVAGSSSPSTTVVSTTFTPTVNTIHVFEMTTNLTGTAINFLIDGSSLATISTNLPNQSSADGWGDMFWVCDNKNTNTSPALTFYRMEISHK